MILILTSTHLHSQISPGDLTNAHADLEGMSNCTQCHDIGNKIPNSKCLACHEEIQQLMDTNSGYHSSTDVLQKDCIVCHSEHHGRKFDMVRFDQDNFDHDLAGYTLEGQHDIIECRDCHKPDFIFDSDIKNRDNTFLGLDQDCISCHDDYHQETLSQDCASCHDIEAFRPAPKFDHDNANFTLKGEHINVECIECHQKEIRNDVEFQIFTDIVFNDCVACHDDVHRGQLDAQCKICHTERSFKEFVGKRTFNHNTTDFELKGQHKKIDCFACHKHVETPIFAFQELNGILENSCIECHDDVHEGRFGTDCAQCHNEESFLSLKSMDSFDHSLTDYPLEGQHIGVDCKSCHESSYSEPIDFSSCNNCHDDYHQGEFLKDGEMPDCNSCHSLQEGFSFSLYTIERHQDSQFPLEGSHLATPCFACHLDEDQWKFRNIGEQCIDCHDNIHDEFISDEYYPENNCTACHQSDSWSNISFDHSETEWPLEGRHEEVNCKDCHINQPPTPENILGQVFKNLDNDCASCHTHTHGSQFEINGVTDCKRCHNPLGWEAAFFNHNDTQFPLEGRHAEIECSACHKMNIINNEEIIEYKIERFECIDCHS